MSTQQRIAASVEQAARVLDRWVDYKRSLARVPAVSVGLVHEGRTVFAKGYGHAHVEKRIRATEATCYRIASISKTFTATAVMQLAERGALQLDDKAHRFLPWFRSKRDAGLAAITLRHLLAHTAGIERDGDTPHWEDGQFPSLPRIQEHVRRGVAVFRPLETFKYSNLGYAVLGQVVAAVTGRPYEDYVRRHIVERLGLDRTSPILTPRIRSALATGYGRDLPPSPRVAFAHCDTHAMAAAAGFTSNATDMCTYMAAHFLGQPVLLSDDSKREMQRVHWLNMKTGRHYGLGLDIWTVNDRLIVGHGGGFPGFITRIGWDPQAKVGVAVLTNALDDLAGTLLNGIFSTVYHFADGGPRSTTAGPEATRRAPTLTRYEGRFSSRWSDVEIVRVGRRLMAFFPKNDSPMVDSVELEYLRGHTFRIASGSEFGYLGERVTFRFNRAGRLTGLSWGPIPNRVAAAGA